MWRVNHFDVSADDPHRAMDFYTNVFGWQFQKWDGPFDYWLIMTGDQDDPGINGGIAKREDPSARIMNFIDVPSVDDMSDRVIRYGGQMIQDKQTIPGIGYFIIIQDTENNMYGLMEEDPNAV